MAPLHLMDEEQELSVEIEGTEFFYHQIHGKVRERIIRSHEKRGRTNWVGAMYDMLKHAITRTKNLHFKGKVVEWKPEFVYRLPEDAIEILQERTGANIERQEEAEANLANTSDSKPEIGD